MKTHPIKKIHEIHVASQHEVHVYCLHEIPVSFYNIAIFHYKYMLLNKTLYNSALC